MRVFTLERYVTREPLHEATLLSMLQEEWKQTGALVTFLGIVRADSIDGKRVIAIEYEAYEPMAHKEIRKLLHETISRFCLEHAWMIHRIGRVQVGETALFVSVGAPHRHEAFQAIEFITHELKKRVPIWKKEIFDDGTHRWKEAEDA